MIPDDVEAVIMTKKDYDRNVEQLLLEKIELEVIMNRLEDKLREIYEMYIEDTNVDEWIDKIKKGEKE